MRSGSGSRGDGESLPWVVWSGEGEDGDKGFGSFRIKSNCMGEPGLSGCALDSPGRGVGVS